jgi:hypothetical protein
MMSLEYKIKNSGKQRMHLKKNTENKNMYVLS